MHLLHSQHLRRHLPLLSRLNSAIGSKRAYSMLWRRNTYEFQLSNLDPERDTNLIESRMRSACRLTRSPSPTLRCAKHFLLKRTSKMPPLLLFDALCAWPPRWIDCQKSATLRCAWSTTLILRATMSLTTSTKLDKDEIIDFVSDPVQMTIGDVKTPFHGVKLK